MSRRLEEDERISDWIDGRLGPRQLDRLEAEFRVDSEFAAAAARLRDQVLAVRVALTADEAAPEPGLAERVLARAATESEPRSSGRGIPAWIWSAAAAVVLVGVTLFVRSFDERAPTTEDVAGAPESALRAVPEEQRASSARDRDRLAERNPTAPVETAAGAGAAGEGGQPAPEKDGELLELGGGAGGSGGGRPRVGRLADTAASGQSEAERREGGLAADADEGAPAAGRRQARPADRGADAPRGRAADFVYVVTVPRAAFDGLAVGPARRATPGPAGPATPGPAGPATPGRGGAPGGPTPKGGGGPGAVVPPVPGAAIRPGIPQVELPALESARGGLVAMATAVPAVAAALDRGAVASGDGVAAFRHRDRDLAWRLDGAPAAVAERLRSLREWAQRRGGSVEVQRVVWPGGGAEEAPEPEERFFMGAGVDEAADGDATGPGTGPALDADRIARILAARSTAIVSPLDRPWVVVRARRDD